MSGGLFYNPFLRPNKGLLKKPDKEYLRLIPKCFQTPGAAGVVDVRGPQPPLCFYQDSLTVVGGDEDGKGMWWRQRAQEGTAHPASDASERRRGCSRGPRMGGRGWGGGRWTAGG